MKLFKSLQVSLYCRYISTRLVLNTHTHTHTHTSSYIHTHTHMITSTSTHTHTHTNTELQTHTCIHKHTLTHTHTRRNIHSYSFSHTHTHIHAPVHDKNIKWIEILVLGHLVNVPLHRPPKRRLKLGVLQIDSELCSDHFASRLCWPRGLSKDPTVWQDGLDYTLIFNYQIIWRT